MFAENSKTENVRVSLPRGAPIHVNINLAELCIPLVLYFHCRNRYA